MGPGFSINRTVIVVDIHPCYEISDFSYILTNSPSIICVLLYLFLFLLSLVTVCGNLLVMMSIMYFTQLHSPTNYLILSLAVADLLVGVLVFPLSMAFSLSSCLYQEDLFCKVRSSFDVFLSTCSILNLCCISIDRYYAVCQPLTYKAKINHRVAGVMILISWGGSALIGMGILIAGLNTEKCEDGCFLDLLMENTVGSVFSFYLPVIIMLCIYLKIFLVALKQARRIQNKTCQSTKSGGTGSKSERKATKTLAIVLGVFILCWTPFFLCITVSPLINNPAPVPVVEALNWLTLVNSMLNPFIYAFFYSWFRTALRMIVTGKICQGDLTNTKLLR
ncbi:trace amine-associated receptor 1-like [Cheilinus undulatus]|uniref:trace amine-associated receptor 1-like n=1 Tax=Cheilinus undulatus TaxID=241271 RepID=UPI001BD525B3|nr:trace amine-associated receptor 1-like [Cheilinus undulatus]